LFAPPGKHGSNSLYVPVDGKVDTSVAQLSRQPASHDEEYMELEDSKHKVYIYDLDKELAESESDEDRPIFIPDIEKHLHKIPKHILIGDDTKAMANMQMVLYNVPTSLTVPKEQDSVRRAIMESRQRARERQAVGEITSVNSENSEGNGHMNTGMVNSSNAAAEQDELDEMDID
jgi:hypothetical protein